GAPKLEMTDAFAVHRRWGWAPRWKSGLPSLWCSRTLLESVVRSRVQKSARIVVIDEASVEGLRVERGARCRLTGATVRRPGQPVYDLAADRVVDASGRGNNSPKWFEAAGLPRAPEEIVEAHAGYASRFYDRPAEASRPKDWWWDGLWIEPEPAHLPRGG